MTHISIHCSGEQGTTGLDEGPAASATARRIILDTFSELQASTRPHAGPYRLDPLVGLDDARKPLRSKLLAVPALRERYLAYVKEIAEKSLDWEKLKPVVDQWVQLIEKEVAAEGSRKAGETSAESRQSRARPKATAPTTRRRP